MENTLNGKTAIVTGASRGIGKAIAIALGKEKMRLALLARSTDQLQEVVDHIRAAGGEALAVSCDLMNSDALKASLREIYRRFESLDLLVSNAGIFLEKPIAEIKLEEWDRVLRTNLTASFLICQSAFLKMKDRKKGRSL